MQAPQDSCGCLGRGQEGGGTGEVLLASYLCWQQALLLLSDPRRPGEARAPEEAERVGWAWWEAESVVGVRGYVGGRVRGRQLRGSGLEQWLGGGALTEVRCPGSCTLPMPTGPLSPGSGLSAVSTQVFSAVGLYNASQV